MSSRPTATVEESTDRLDITVTTIRVAGSGIWTLVSHADGVDLLTSPSGRIIDTNRLDDRHSPQVAAIMEAIERYF